MARRSLLLTIIFILLNDMHLIEELCLKDKPFTVLCCVMLCHREFGRWKVNSLAVERRESSVGNGGLALPLDPDFMHTIRQLGRRPSLQTITESLIKKYGTHVLVSATLGGTLQ